MMCRYTYKEEVAYARCGWNAQIPDVLGLLIN